MPKKSIRQFDAGELFSGRASGTKITGFSAPSEYTPSVDSNYAFHESARDIIVWLLSPHPEPLYIWGPTGCGKSSLIRQIAARINYPVLEANGHDRLEVQDLIGHLTVINGSMTYQDGPLTMAARTGGIFLLNEIDLCSPAMLAGLNTILDGAPLCLAENGGEIVEPSPYFRFVATANTSGSGDDTGMYQGVLRQNMAFLDRFVMVEAGYPSVETETGLLTARYPQLPQDLCRRMADFASIIRRAFVGELRAEDKVPSGISQLEVSLSTRTLLRWADLTVRYAAMASQGIKPIDYALDRALGFRTSKDTRMALHEICQRVCG